MRCRFCSSPAVAIVALSEGCFCFPEDRDQALCLQHLIKATPLGEMQVTNVLVPELYEFLGWEWPLPHSLPDVRDAIR